MNNQDKKEKEIIAAAQQDPKYFSALYELYYPKVLRFLLSKIRDPELARDTCQDVFLQALENLSDYKGKSNFFTWLCSIAINKFRNLEKIQKARPTLTLSEVELNAILDEVSDEARTIEEEIKQEEQLRLALSLRSNEELDILRMRFVCNMTFPEIGHVLNISMDNAKKKSSRMMLEMRKVMESPFTHKKRTSEKLHKSRIFRIFPGFYTSLRSQMRKNYLFIIL